MRVIKIKAFLWGFLFLFSLLDSVEFLEEFPVALLLVQPLVAGKHGHFTRHQVRDGDVVAQPARVEAGVVVLQADLLKFSKVQEFQLELVCLSCGGERLNI